MMMPPAVARQAEIDRAVRRVEKSLAPEVAMIRYHIDEDWSGRWAIFFRIVLSDEASRRERLGDIVSEVISQLSERLDFDSLGVFPYHNFRNTSEQASLREEAWA